MIKLYQFARTWGIPNLGQFNVKVETYMRMADIPYELVETLPLKGPKGKLPYIEDNGKKIADSTFIIEHLKETYGDSLDSALTAQQLAVGVAIQRLLEDHLYWVGMYTRWLYTEDNWQTNKTAIFGGMRPVIRDIAAFVYRRFIIAKQIRGHGMGRHSSEEIFRLGEADLDALSDLLGDNPYFMGESPTSVDASAFGVLINTMGCPIESPVKEYALTKPNLSAYCDRIKQQYFPEISGAS